MASIELYNDAAAVSKIGSSLSQRVVGTFARVSHWNEARKTRAELLKLSSRELEDIGLSYADVLNIR